MVLRTSEALSVWLMTRKRLKPGNPQLKAVYRSHAFGGHGKIVLDMLCLKSPDKAHG